MVKYITRPYLSLGEPETEQHTQEIQGFKTKSNGCLLRNKSQ